jgi:hypothetical protein
VCPDPTERVQGEHSRVYRPTNGESEAWQFSDGALIPEQRRLYANSHLDRGDAEHIFIRFGPYM